MLPLIAEPTSAATAGAVAGNEHARAERDHRGIDGDHADADGRPARRAARAGGRRPRRRRACACPSAVVGGAALAAWPAARTAPTAAAPAGTGAGRPARARRAEARCAAFARASISASRGAGETLSAAGSPRSSCRFAAAAALARGDGRVCPPLGGRELVSSAGEAHELVRAACARALRARPRGPGSERRTLERVDSGEHPGERAGSEQDRDRVGVAVHVEARGAASRPSRGRRERAADDRDVGARPRGPPRAPGVAAGAGRRGSGACERGLGGEEIEDGRALARSARDASSRPVGAPDELPPCSEETPPCTARDIAHARAQGRGPYQTNHGCLQTFSQRLGVQTSDDAARLPDLWPVTPPSASLSSGERDAA